MYLWARFLHFDNPIPTHEDKLKLGSYCGKNFTQVDHFLL
jgi:hypothetical protein